MSIDRSQIPTLYPVPTPLEAVPGFAVGHQVTLHLRESFDNFTIVDIDSQPVLNVKSRFGMSRRKGLEICVGEAARKAGWKTYTPFRHAERYFIDNHGNTVLSLKGKKYSFTAQDSSKREVLTVSSPVMSADTKLDATFVNSNTQTAETVHITGKWPGDIVEMFWRGHLVGLILRQFTRRDILGQNTYLLTVAPNVDLCLMAALCVCVDERREAT